jgi:hypothetical protein
MIASPSSSVKGVRSEHDPFAPLLAVYGKPLGTLDETLLI